jgi:hypothetical protein
MQLIFESNLWEFAAAASLLAFSETPFLGSFLLQHHFFV